jgi:hypothetical protein
MTKNKMISIVDYTIHCLEFDKPHKINTEGLKQILKHLDNNNN